MGKKKNREMLFWTKAEYLKFADAMMDKPVSFYAFEMLYWCGIREGELLALTLRTLILKSKTVTISKSFQHLNGRDIITTPQKQKKSNRTIRCRNSYCGEMNRTYLSMLYDVKPDNRIFPITKKLSVQRNAERRQAIRREANSHSRPSSQPHKFADRYGIFSGGDCRPCGT